MRSRPSVSSLSVRLACLSLCYLLVIAPAVMTARGSGSAPAKEAHQPKGATVNNPPEAHNSALAAMIQGAPGVSNLGYNLPNLDALRTAQPADATAPPPTASTQPCPDCTSCATCDAGNYNHPPIANAGGPYSAQVNQSVNFNGLASFDSDPNDQISAYQWNFGDNTSDTGPVPIHAYAATGTYTVTLTVLDSHNVQAIESQTVSVNPASAPSSLTPTAQGNAAVFVAQSVPTSMIADQSYPVSVTMRNNGTKTWTAARLYRLGDPTDQPTWGLSRLAVPTDVAPGAEVTFNFTVSAPHDEEGGSQLVNFQWRIVQDGVEWFGETTPSQSVTVTTYSFPSGVGPETHPPTDLSSARLAPQNRTGEADEDLYSGNYNWSLPVLNLTGRAGLDTSLALTYNSLVWTRTDLRSIHFRRAPVPPAITYDADRGFPGPGFRLGFPSIQGPFYNDQANGVTSYLLIMPSGAHVELRRVGSSNAYEAVDSSHLQLLTGGDAGQMLLRGTDGTQMTYLAINGEYRCTGIKDRNGNYLTIKYDAINGGANFGRMTSIIDTVGRTINFTYDANYRLQSITQGWGGATHTWATFGYTDINVQTNFLDETGAAMTVQGLPANHIVSALSRVGLADGSHYDFAYTSWGQVWTISRFADEGTAHQLAYIRHNLPVNNSTPQADCPRFTQRLAQANDWNGSAPATTDYQFAQDGQTGQMITPDGTLYRETYATEGWQKGLTIQTDTYSADDLNNPQRTTTTNWTQDNTSLLYKLNPRPTEIIVRDAGKRRKTLLEYTSYGLPLDTFELEPGGVSGGNEQWLIIRRTHTDYNLSDTYLSRHIIGVPQAQYVFARNISPDYQSQVLMSKVTYEYDADGGYLQNQGNPVQHDAAYNAGLLARGNPTGVRRWNVNDESNSNSSVASTTGYNTAGGMIFNRDPMWHAGQMGHEMNVSYTDSGTGGGNTLAYPTTVTDADGFSSTTQYRYDIGARTRLQTPRPLLASPLPTQILQPDPVQTFEYDSVGRAKKSTNLVTGATTEWIYPASQTVLISKTTVSDESINNDALKAYSFTVLDGAGRARATAQDMSGSNSALHYSGQYISYDVMGRAYRTYNSTEVDGTWSAAGDDAVNTQGGTGGWRFTTQNYDWKGRPTLTVNTDQTIRQISYDGCGCAGSDTETLTDELGHQKKIYHDSLGREIKSEVLNTDSAHSVYTSHTTSYNALDQVLTVKDHLGAVTDNEYCPTSQCQGTDFSYDGLGRLKSRHLPAQDVGKETSYEYNPDDTVHQVTDARGASAIFDYNGRHQLKSVLYGLATNVSATNNVEYGYDGAGNRTSMTEKDAQGNVTGGMTYNYDPLSRLQSETRYFSELSNTSTGGHYTIAYRYNLANQLTSVTDPTNNSVSYAHDTIGRLTGITGSSFGNVTQYASAMEYRAWGALKQMTYGNNLSLTIGYNARLQASSYNIPGLISKSYQYYANGQIRSSTDGLDQRFDRFYAYDHANRMTQALSGAEARGEAPTTDRPYKQSFQYDWTRHLMARPDDRRWAVSYSTFTQQNYLYNRNLAWSYDVEGNLKDSQDVQYNYDAESRVVHTHSGTMDLSQRLDGDGRSVRKEETSYYIDQDTGTQAQQTNIIYQVRSSVLDKRVLTEMDYTGNKLKTFVYAGSNVLAWQQQSGTSQSVFWEHRDQSNASYRVTDRNAFQDYDQAAELDPLGTNQRTSNPFTRPSLSPTLYKSDYPGFGNPFGSSVTLCMVDFIERPCDEAFLAVGHGVGYIDFNIGDGPSTPNFVPRKVYDPDTYGPDHPKDPNAPINIYEHYHYELVPVGSLSSSVQAKSLTQQPPPVPLSRSEVSSLVGDILKLFKDHPGCEEWTNKLLAEMSTSSGFNAGTIRDILENFRKNGTLYSDHKVLGSGSGSTGTGIGGRPSVTLTFGTTPANTAVTLMHEIIHWAGRPAKGNDYADYYDDAAMAKAWNKLGVVMSADQYRRAFPDVAARDTKQDGYDFAESRLAGAANHITCLGEQPAVRTLP